MYKNKFLELIDGSFRHKHTLLRKVKILRIDDNTKKKKKILLTCKTQRVHIDVYILLLREHKVGDRLKYKDYYNKLHLRAKHL